MKHMARTFLIVLAFSFLLQTACASISSAQLLFDNGTIALLNYDSNTQSYADGSAANRNVLVKICATDAADLQDKFAGIFYKVGDTVVEIDVLPAKMVTLVANCATVDLDLSLFKARYAGIPNIGVADTPSMTSPTYYQLAVTEGWLSGDFEVTYTSSDSVSASVSKALTETNTEITLSRNYIVLGIKDAVGTVIDSGLVELDESATLTKPSGSFTFNVNGIDVTGTNSEASVAAAAVTLGGAPESGYPCTFRNTFDKIIPENPARILIDNYCTYLRQIELGVEKTVSNIDVVVNGNIDVRGNTPPYGQVLQYGEITANTEDFSVVKVIFKVPKSWIVNNSINAENGVKLNRYTDSWERLATNRIDEDAEYIYYESYSKGLSYFAITGEKKSVIVQFCGDGKCAGTENFISCPQDCPASGMIVAFLPKMNWLLMIIMVLTIITLISYSTARHFRMSAIPKKSEFSHSELNHPELKIPELPKFTMPAVKFAPPELPKVNIPTFTPEAHTEMHIKLPDVPALELPYVELPAIHDMHRGILEDAQKAELEMHPHPEVPEITKHVRKVPRFMPKTLADYKNLPKRIARLQKKVNLAKEKIESQLERTDMMKAAAARHAKKYLKPAASRTKMPYIKEMESETKLAERELEGKIKPVKQKLPKPVYMIDHHRFKKPEMRRLIRNLPKNLKEVSETVEGVGKGR